MINKNTKWVLFGVLLLLGMFVLPSAIAVTPNGANVVRINSSTAAASVAGSDNAIAGNITSINLWSRSTTQAWQGYFGNVTGVIQLADGSGNTMYNWSQASPRGEVYASTNQTIFWTNIQCFNYSATGTYTNEAGNGGQTNKFGTNLSTLQTIYGISNNASNYDPDSINGTFNLLGAGTHAQFFTANKQFSVGQCQNTRIYDSTGAGVAGKFEEVLQYEPVSASVIFTSLLNQDVSGFDSKTHDFEMLVPENGHGTDTSTTPYYFYVELQ
jgi:hypothetical protein